ncbi:MAG TPA: ABC transporter ATP-binding protein [Candidatus Avoscillospira stercorigallinarum]|uniref:ABC transporter ATP-binding protein n=1 Tax=Candidatus Avoscillospira stercorigallinarum TaxID=2840708 RepID=A0A9D0Z6P6_9FIRM|nr:ABC transporter ATP-binding protein [Candidatus Avoscillospira stercorigallinarum]
MRADKSTYHVFQNVAWMCSLAWKHRRRVLFFCGLSAALEILYQLIQLFLAPRILTLVEEAAALQTLLGTIALFTAALFALRFGRGYLEQIDLFARIDVRSVIIGLLGRKCNTTSYPNTLKPEFIKLRDVAHTASDGNQEATEQIWHTLTELCKNVGGFAVYLTILSHLDPILLLVTIATCLAGFWIARRTSGWIYRHRDEEEAYITRKRYIHRVAESVPVAKDIRIFGLQNWINDLYASVHDVYLAFRLRAEKVKLLAELTEAVLTMARNGIAYGYLIQMALLEHLSVGEFLLYFTAISTFTQWVMGILQASLKLHTQSLDISRVREFLDYPEPFRFSGGAALPDRRPYELTLEDVSFRYDGAETDTLRHLNLSIRPGEKLAIVGLNGAGKTTLVKLLCGLLDPTEGRVLLNGVDVRQFNRQEYYGLFSAVFQEFSILNVTIAENIAQNTANIDDARVNACIDQAGLTQAVAQLPQGAQTYVGREVFLDGVLFSGGQTQLLMLARALYKDSPILILDEPTAALDPLAENDIYLKYNDMTAGKTSLFISHRLASTRFCDRIILLADGGIAEEGTHESLLAAGGAYASLFAVQSRYYQEGREF